MVQDVRRDEGFEPWPRLLDRLVEFSDEVVDFWRSGLERCSDAGRWDGSIFALWGEDAGSATICLYFRWLVGVVPIL